MARNKDETQQRLLAAALQIAAEDGFSALGVNAVARAAGADKQLIYRYFGGLDGLLAAAGEAVAARLADGLGLALAPPPASYAELAQRLALTLLHLLTQDPVYRQLRLMEASAPSPATEAFRLARGKVLLGWVAMARGALVPPAGVDMGAVNAVVVAAVEGLAIFGPIGMDRTDAQTLTRLRTVLAAVIDGMYGDGAGGRPRPDVDPLRPMP